MSVGQDKSGQKASSGGFGEHGQMSYVAETSRENETVRIMGDGTEMSFSERLAYAVRLVPPEKLDAYVGRSSKQMSRYLKGADVPWSVVLAISVASGVPVDWIAAGRPTFGPSEMDHWRESLSADEIRDEFAFLPRYGIDAAAGPGLVVSSEEIEETLAFRRDWLRRIGANPAASGLITAKGDSMDPTIPSGALMLVDTSDVEPTDGCIYVIARDGTLVVKRVQRLRLGVQLISDNPIYPPETVPREEMAEMRIAGRVRWVGRAL